jgi:uncharacterized membrane protein YccC
MSGFFIRIERSLPTAIQFTLVSFLSFSLALLLTAGIPGAADSQTVGAMWAMISSIVVMQETRSATLDTAWLRIFGSLAGAVISAVYLTFLPFSTPGMALLIGLTVLICQVSGIPGHARLAALTVGVVMVISAMNPGVPPFVNAGTRFLEVIIGSTVAVAIVWAWPYLSRSGGRSD